MSDLPRIFRVRQNFDAPLVENIEAEVEAQLSQLQLQNKVQAGQSVAVTGGSRGIANIHRIIKATVQHLKGLGTEPFIVPAMGSHGGGTAEGQREILENYGISEEYCGCPIRSSMETVIVCEAQEGFPVHFDKNAYDADHVVVCNRVKPHTNFVGDIESGLMKMMLIGLGKHEGAKIYHRAIKNFSFGQIVRSVAREVLAKCNILAGVATVENQYDQTAKLAAVAPDDFEEHEKQLLVEAKQWMPRLPFDRADVLAIDEIGKNISGSGMDTNVIGRKYLDHQARDDEFPKIKQIIIRGLTESTHGNACGIGMAEFCLARAADAMNSNITNINALTGGHATSAMVPMTFPTDRQAIEAAMSVIGLIDPPDSRLMWIRNTLDVKELECSAAYWDEARERSDLEILCEPRELPLDDNGNLPDSVVSGVTAS